ncbi:hypothetical protein [Paraflavitalea sp. CAU 1676]|uniref:hypothetical protein n=1 Tax=Paraflavitalea sp. CAU 1676 TaxID=3032598 RepID=UPI0023D9FFC3|nr:hypothetical protein [Paraflavitalea sp. CAU 1676]MDF2191368.1 hypothetical protein [Paraflavitalea sp. CAU 1676]
MKKCFIIILISPFGLSASAQTWNEWFRQKKTQTKYTLLQIAKLQYYLKTLKDGYNLVHDGLDLISDIKNGDFNLHDFFLSEKYRVKTIVRESNDVRIIQQTYQEILAESRRLEKRIKSLQPPEQEIIEMQLSSMRFELQDDMDQLITLLSSGKLQMEDDERLRQIAYVSTRVSEKKQWLLKIRSSCESLLSIRKQSLKDINSLRQLNVEKP